MGHFKFGSRYLPNDLRLSLLVPAVVDSRSSPSPEHNAQHIKTRITMAFGSKTFMGKREREMFDNSLVGKYQKLVKKNSFVFFGLPMMLSIALGSIFLTSVTSLRYERRDEKVQEMGEEEALNLINNRRKVNIKDEYYKLQGLLDEHEDWEPKRVERLPGESDNKW
jgi:cytochrome c oxidase assembly protein subunit 16